jgi:hypothetical protein
LSLRASLTQYQEDEQHCDKPLEAKLPRTD